VYTHFANLDPLNYKYIKLKKTHENQGNKKRTTKENVSNLDSFFLTEKLCSNFFKSILFSNFNITIKFSDKKKT
jgi:hypothetical protein